MLSPLHAVLDELVLEITFVNYNPVIALHLSLRTFTAGNDTPQEYTNLPRRGKNSLILKTMRRSPIPLKGWNINSCVRAWQNSIFQTFPRPAEEERANHKQVQTSDPASIFPDHTLDTAADRFRSAGSASATRSTSIS